jgi:hypothetical protein
VKLDANLIPYAKINSKQIKELSIRAKAIKLFKENTEGKLLDIEFGDDFLDMTPKA